MTTLESFLKKIPNDVHLISGYQKTSRSLFLSFSEIDFLKIVNRFPKKQFTFKFLEKTPDNALLVHLAFDDGRMSLHISFEIKAYSLALSSKLKARFPSAEIYLKGIF